MGLGVLWSDYLKENKMLSLLLGLLLCLEQPKSKFINSFLFLGIVEAVAEIIIFTTWLR